MAYRCGWAAKPGQERVLAIDITRGGFAWALEHSALSHFDPEIHADETSWSAQVEHSPVRIQWDPERDLHHRPLDHRSIQIGLRGEAVDAYVEKWIVTLTDITATMREIATHLQTGNLDAAAALLPEERPYPVPEELAEAVGTTPVR